jgi:hypothetical protein
VTAAVDTLAARRIVHPAAVVELAAAADLELAAAAVLLEKESGGGRNLWGHDGVDTGGFYRKGAPVTREAYEAWKPHRGRLGSQGVGPCQLTWPGFQDRADARGGCWDWRVNVAVGFEILADLIRAHGIRGGFRRYNGSGPAADRYAVDALARLERWRARLGPDRAGPGPVLRRRDRGRVVEELQHALNARGARLVVDGVYGPATENAVRNAQRAARITADGIVGPQTRAALGL